MVTGLNDTAEFTTEVVVAGHICVDVIPGLDAVAGGLGTLLVPGKLVECGPAVVSTGGAVSNTGLALHRLGVGVRLVGKVGGDAFGRAALELLSAHGPELARGMIVAPGEHTSYSVVLSPPGTDRIFLHHPGANHTFGADDIHETQLRGARLFHFGYPPVMKRMYADEGRELADIMRRGKECGLATSLDMSRPDPDTDAGRADWPRILERALPHTDIFLPSVEEIIFMLDRGLYEKLESEHGAADMIRGVDRALLGRIADRIIELGAAIAVIKLGAFGLYMKTTADKSRLSSIGNNITADPEAWAGRDLYGPCFEVEVAGATGAGDSTIAGFLAATLKGLGPEQTLTTALATGACSVEKSDATSGIPVWEGLQERMQSNQLRRKENAVY